MIWTPELSVELWYRALANELGLSIAIDPADIEGIRTDLYAARREIGDERLSELSLFFNEPGTELLIYHNATARLE